MIVCRPWVWLAGVAREGRVPTEQWANMWNVLVAHHDRLEDAGEFKWTCNLRQRHNKGCAAAHEERLQAKLDWNGSYIYIYKAQPSQTSGLAGR